MLDLVMHEFPNLCNMKEFIEYYEKIKNDKIHLINISEKEFLDNLEKRQKSIIEIVRTAIILHGQSKYVEIMKNVKSI